MHPALTRHVSKLVAARDSLKNRLDAHKGAIRSAVMSTVHKAETTAAGATAAAIDHYFGKPDASGLPEATIGPAPIVLALGFAGSAVAYAFGDEDVGKHLHALSDGFLSAGAYSATLRMLRSMGTPAAG